MLSRGDRWLDYREFDLRGNRARSDQNLVIETHEDSARVEGLVAGGESETREFKREVAGNTFLKTVAAFANAQGGVILFGIEDTEGEVKGIKGEVAREMERIINMVRDVVVPQPNIRIRNCKLRGKNVIALFVEEGGSPPYGLDPTKPRFYVRRGSTTFPATQAEIRLLGMKNQREAEGSLLPWMAL